VLAILEVGLMPDVMSAMPVETKTLKLIPQTREEVRASIAQLQPHERKEVSPAWLALLEGWFCDGPWRHG